MKKKIACILIVLSFLACEKKIDYLSYGDPITDDGLISKEELFSRMKNLKNGDTLNVKIKSTINSVCQKKGCWMKLDLVEDTQLHVKFKDYAFFVPMNSEHKETIIEGKAFVSVVEVEELKHYAQDAGESQENIDKIVAPEVTYSFLANGVLIGK